MLIETVDGGRDNKRMNQWLMESERMYDGMKRECEFIKRGGKGTWGSEFDYLKVCIGRALVSHLANRLTEAHNRWQNARKSAEVYKNKVTRFISMIIDYCDCNMNMKLGRLEEAEKLRKRANSYFSEVGREYWWIGWGTFLLDWLKASIPNSGIDTGREITPNWNFWFLASCFYSLIECRVYRRSAWRGLCLDLPYVIFQILRVLPSLLPTYLLTIILLQYTIINTLAIREEL